MFSLSLSLSFLYFRFLIVESAINSASAFLVSSICFSLWRRFDDFEPCWENNFWNLSACWIFKLFDLERRSTRVASNTDFGGALLYRLTFSMASFHFFSYSFSASLRFAWSSLTLAFTFCLSNVSFVTLIYLLNYGWLHYCRGVYLYLICETSIREFITNSKKKSSLKQTVEFELDFCRLHRQEKSSSNSTKNQVCFKLEFFLSLKLKKNRVTLNI